MNDKKITSQFVDELIDSISAVEPVDVPPFFKDKVLQKLGRREVNEVPSIAPWFTPRYQLAALLLFIFLNAAVLYYYSSTRQQQELETFADSYGLSASQQESLLN